MNHPTQDPSKKKDKTAGDDPSRDENHDESRRNLFDPSTANDIGSSDEEEEE